MSDGISDRARAMDALKSTHSNWVNVASQAEFLDVLKQRVAAGDGFSVATLNLDLFVKLRSDNAFREAFSRSDYVTADGFPIVWACRLAGLPAERTTGSDLVLPIVHCAAELGVPISIVGTTQDVIDETATRLGSLAPQLRTGLLRSPQFGFTAETDEATEILSRLGELGPNICFLALGAPKQELLAARGRSLAPQTAFICVGAGIDFIAGRQTRASPLVQSLNLEWAWRLYCEPRRLFVRYVKCALALPYLMATALKARFA